MVGKTTREHPKTEEEQLSEAAKAAFGWQGTCYDAFTTTPLMQLPKTRSAEKFENMCADVLSKLYGCPFEQYGRQGQKQNGIDLIGSQIPPMHIVAQCKNYYALPYEKLRKQLIEDIEATENLPFSFPTFIGMTSLEQDVVTKDIVLNTIVPFKVEIMFWEDIQRIL